MPTGEAVDLVRMLPRGSAWRAAVDPTGAWDGERSRHADTIDAINRIAWALGVWDRAEMPEPPRMPRPGDPLARERAARAAREARESVESGGWEEV